MFSSYCKCSFKLADGITDFGSMGWNVTQAPGVKSPISSSLRRADTFFGSCFTRRGRAEKCVCSPQSTYQAPYNITPPPPPYQLFGASRNQGGQRSTLIYQFADFVAYILQFLDLSATFYTAVHELLLKRLNSKYSICGTALDWFRSYLTNHMQVV